MTVPFRLRFDRSVIHDLASRYIYSPGEHVVIDEVSPDAKKHGCLTQDQLFKIGNWKSTRASKQCKNNDENFVHDVTLISLSALHERVRIETLTLLYGVGWPTASAILHLCSGDRYPILDFRALWSLSVVMPKKYDFDFWISYTQFCRQLADESKVTMRMLDRALWQFSKES